MLDTPNSPLRAAVTALALAAATTPPAAPPEPPGTEPAHRRAARYAWALLLARIDEVFPLVCPNCGGAMRIIACITDASTIRDILVHVGASPVHQRNALRISASAPTTSRLRHRQRGEGWAVSDPFG